MTSVILPAVRRHGLASRFAQLMHVGGRMAVGVIAPKHVEDSPHVPRPYVGCIVMPWATYAEGQQTRELTVRETWPDLTELRYEWDREYVGHDGEGEKEFSVRIFEPPRGRAIAFISYVCFAALHGGAEVKISTVTLEDLMARPRSTGRG